MKILNKAVCLLAFFAVAQSAAVSMQQTTQQNQPAPNQPAPVNVPNKPVPAPAPNKPVIAPQQQGQKESYKTRHDRILASPTSVAMVDGNALKPSFIADTITAATNNDLGQDGLRALLETARDKWVKFTGNDADDLAILRSINKQIDDAVAQMQ